METIECWQLALESSNTPSVLSLTRQNLDPVRKKYSDTNKCSFGAYEVLRTNNKINLTIMASGSEVKLAIETSLKLAKDKIYSKGSHSISFDTNNLGSGLYFYRLDGGYFSKTKKVSKKKVFDRDFFSKVVIFRNPRKIFKIFAKWRTCLLIFQNLKRDWKKF